MPAEPNPFEVRLREVFAEALEKPSPEARQRYLDEACAGDPRLRSRAEALLRAHEGAGAFLGQTVHGEDINLVADASGTTIGPYRLIEKLGEGGFGIVYRAEQTAPVRREVALKIIKMGMDTKEVIARFEAERQALALMEHPHIARVYDAGATETGRPYFVMDLIVGQPITGYCNQRQLAVAQRLALFLQVCDAVQHAHARGIVHRDLKPSNVVVVEENGQPLVKVIDFGIAKSMQGRLTDRTLITRREVLLGTPVYMSPEQLNVGADTVDTRSDVYSLGVLLYELIAGAPPFESDMLRHAAFYEVQRILREVEPPKPSTRLTQARLAKRSATSARSEVRSPKSEIDKDLDCIVMQALEKEPARRYPSAAALAMDLQHHLRHEPVLARPPSPVYRLGRLCRRHRTAVVAGAAVAVVLLAAGLFAWQQHRAAGRRARMAATDAAEPRAGQQLIRGVANVEKGAALSPDETMLAFVDYDGPDWDLWVRDLRSGEKSNLTQSEKHDPGVFHMCPGVFVWSPDSQWLAYTWADERLTLSLRVIAVNSVLPSVSVAGTNLRYSVEIDMRGLEPRVLYGDTNMTYSNPEAWTHDGRQVLCRRSRPGGMALVDIKTGAIRALPVDTQLKHPRFSLDDRYLVFSRSNQVYLLEVQTGRQSQLTFLGNNSTPIWAPNDPVVLFSSDRLGSWDLWGVRIENGRPASEPFPVRYGIGSFDKRLTQSGKLIVHRKVPVGDGYTIAEGAPADDVSALDPFPGRIYLTLNRRLHTLTSEAGRAVVRPVGTDGQPSQAPHAGQRWFLQSRELPETNVFSGHPRRELFAVTLNGPDERAVQLTTNPRLTPRGDCHWAMDYERRLADGRVSWMARYFGPTNSGAPPSGIYSAQVVFDAAGHLTGLAQSSIEPLVAENHIYSEFGSASHDWSPDGTRLVYAVGPRRSADLYILDLATRQTRILTQGIAPVWSPDGSLIAFRRGYDAILTIRPDGSGLQKVDQRTGTPGATAMYPFPGFRELVWSPDSSALLYGYLDLTSDVRDIYRIARTGGESQNLTRSILQSAVPIAWLKGEN